MPKPDRTSCGLIGRVAILATDTRRPLSGQEGKRNFVDAGGRLLYFRGGFLSGTGEGRFFMTVLDAVRWKELPDPGWQSYAAVDKRTPPKEASMRREETNLRQQVLLGAAILLVVIPSLLVGVSVADGTWPPLTDLRYVLVLIGLVGLLLLRFRTPAA